MASNPFTLAALATTAVPGIELRGTVDDGSDADADHGAATMSDGRTVRISVPRTSTVLQRMRAQATALGAATDGVRERLPFEIPTLLGRAATGDTEVFVWTRLGGRAAVLDDLGTGSMASSVAAAVAAIHDLPTSVIADASLPHRSAPRVRDDVLKVFDRAVATRRVPTPLLQRWEQAADNAELWQFTPTVVHGDLQAAALRVDEGLVHGVDGWHGLSVGDPARDLAWVLGSADFDAVDSVFADYALARPGDRFLRSRAMLHAEIDIARWLLFGVERDDTATIEDAVGMLGELVGRVDDEDAAVSLQPRKADTMDLSEVQLLLEGNRSLGVVRASQSEPPTAAASATDLETVPLEPSTSDADTDTNADTEEAR